jgi:hypothetical protein
MIPSKTIRSNATPATISKRMNRTYGLGGESSSAGDKGGGDGGLHFVRVFAKRLEVWRREQVTKNGPHVSKKLMQIRTKSTVTSANEQAGAHHNGPVQG